MFKSALLMERKIENILKLLKSINSAYISLNYTDNAKVSYTCSMFTDDETVQALEMFFTANYKEKCFCALHKKKRSLGKKK